MFFFEQLLYARAITLRDASVVQDLVLLLLLGNGPGQVVGLGRGTTEIYTAITQNLVLLLYSREKGSHHTTF